WSTGEAGRYRPHQEARSSARKTIGRSSKVSSPYRMSLTQPVGYANEKLKANDGERRGSNTSMDAEHFSLDECAFNPRGQEGGR
ncbi:MAG: hypothetical protein ABI856_08725, partial [Nitrospira sp.]